MRFRQRLETALLQRRRVNARYSLRAFARSLRVDHATLSLLLKGRRRTTTRTIRAWGPKLGLSEPDVHEACMLENEAAVVAALEHAAFRADSRWLAMTLNIPLDDVNVALQSLLRKRLLRMRSKNVWQPGA